MTTTLHFIPIFLAFPDKNTRRWFVDGGHRSANATFFQTLPKRLTGISWSHLDIFSYRTMVTGVVTIEFSDFNETI